MNNIVEYGLYLVILIGFAIFLGNYMAKVMNGEKTLLSKITSPLEKGICFLLRVDTKEQMSGKKYAFAVLGFSIVSLVLLVVMQLIQGMFYGKSVGSVPWDLAFNTAVSFVTNTNWQAYSGEVSLSYFVQAMGLTVQNFLSAAVGISVLFALIRGFAQFEKKGLGSFWGDMIKIVVHILLPLNIVIAIILSSNGVVQSFDDYERVTLIEPIAIDSQGEIIKDAIIKDGKIYLDNKLISDGTIITEQVIPLGPAASQVAIKQTGTNGGGFFGVNSAHPLENPNALTNIIEMISILLIPAALCFTFGRNVKNNAQGRAIFMAMLICLIMALGAIAISEQLATPGLRQNGDINISSINQSGGNMEGKEARFGIVASSTWAAFTTAASSGSVNSMHDSYTPLGGMVTMILMQLGEVVFGGVGCGLYGMLAFTILTIFIAGLMVGRTPEFLGKKIEPYEMKWAVLVCLATPIAILVGSGIAAALPQTHESLNNGGAHGFSEMLYAYSSAGGNNGSAFAGFNANTVFLNVSLGMVMLFARFLPIIGTLCIASSLSNKKRVAATSGTLSTTNGLFVFVLIFVVLLIGALSFLPALALGPIAEFFQSIG